MQEKKYSYISNYFNNFIDNRNSIYTLSINFIYNHRFRRFYNYFYKAFDSTKEYSFGLDTRELLKIFKVILISLFFNKKLNIKKNKKIDTLVIDHLFNLNSDIKNSKIYGDLFSELIKKKISYKRLLINHSNKIQNKNLFIDNIIVNRTTNVKLIIIHIYNLISEYKYFKKIFNNEKKLINKRLLGLLSKKIISSENLNNLIIADQVYKFILLFKFNKILFTFEGNAWERILIYKIKESKLKCKIIGYNHTGIYKYHNAIRKNFKYNLSPDEIFCISKYSYNEFIKLNLIEKNQIKIIGYLNNIYKSKKTKDLNYDKKDIIFLPTAEEDECLDLFNLLINFIKHNKGNNCIFRLHPMTDKKTKLYIEQKIKSIKEKVIISINSDINKDLNKSFIAIYRDTSSIIYAAINRTLPVYFKNDEYLENDIISKDYKKNISINNYEELNNLISNIKKNNIDKKNIESIYNFCDEYYQLPNYDLFL